MAFSCFQAKGYPLSQRRAVTAGSSSSRHADIGAEIVCRRFGVDTVEKGIFRNLEATLVQDRKPTCNLDSKIHMAGFVRFKF
jgi:hypothetical protein